MISRQFTKESEKARFETFIDAILAIIMTILVLEFKVPEEAFPDDRSIQSHTYHLIPSLVSYFISFSTIVILWLDHHNLFRLLTRIDIPMVMLNFLFILFLSATPYTTSLAGRNFYNPFAVNLVAINYLAMNIAFSSIWFYAMRKKMIPEILLAEISTKKENAIILAGILLQLISIPAAYISTYIPFIFFTMILIIHIYRIWSH